MLLIFLNSCRLASKGEGTTIAIWELKMKKYFLHFGKHFENGIFYIVIYFFMLAESKAGALHVGKVVSAVILTCTVNSAPDFSEKRAIEDMNLRSLTFKIQ